jgi:diguanylate cyclase (GGDEF)-like protein
MDNAMFDLERIGVPAFAIAVGADGSFRYSGVNALSAAQSGLPADMLIGKTPQEVFTPEVAERLCGHYRSCAAQRALVDYEVSAEFPSGRSWWQASLMPLIGVGGVIETIVGTCHEPSTDRRVDAGLRAANKHLDLAIRCLKGADWRFDVRSGRYDASNNLALLLGEERPRPVAWSEWAERVVAEDVAGTSCDRLLSGEATEQVVRFRFRNARDEMRWAQCRRLISTDDVAAPVICGVIVDVTEERQRELKLEAEACRDSLTGLLNRRGFYRDMERALSRPEAPAGSLALFMVDLDGFKGVNDTLGHIAGDAVLSEVGRRLTTSLGERAVAARLGGDEFVVACPGMERNEAVAIERWLGEVLGRPFQHGGIWIGMGGSIGPSWCGGDLDLHAMIADADEQLYIRKRERKTTASRAAALQSDERNQMSLFAA